MIEEADLIPRVYEGYLNDLSWIVPLDSMCFGASVAWSRRHFRQELSRRGVRLSVVRRRGYIMYRKWGAKFEIIGVAVHPRHRHRGIGRMLMKHVMDQAVTMDGARIFLEVNCRNEAAIRMYENLDFVTVRRLDDFYGKGEDAFEMVRIYD